MGWTGVGTLLAFLAAAALFAGSRDSEKRNVKEHQDTRDQVAKLSGTVGNVQRDVGNLQRDVGQLTETVTEGFEALQKQIGNLQPQTADEPETSHTDIGGGNIIITDPDTADPENVAAANPRRLPAGAVVTGSFPAPPIRGARQVVGAGGQSGNP